MMEVISVLLCFLAMGVLAVFVVVTAPAADDNGYLRTEDRCPDPLCKSGYHD